MYKSFARIHNLIISESEHIFDEIFCLPLKLYINRLEEQQLEFCIFFFSNILFKLIDKSYRKYLSLGANEWIVVRPHPLHG